MIPPLQLRDFLDRAAAIYLQNGLCANEARGALIWLNDPRAVKPLVQDIEKNPAALKRHALLLSGMMRDQPAEPVLVKHLDSADVEMRLCAAEALADCGDAKLEAQIAKLVADADPRVRLAGARMGFAMSGQAYADVRPLLLPLLKSDAVDLRLEAACRFAARDDAVAAVTLLDFWKRPAPPPNGDWRIMQAIAKLANQTFNYDLHNWGPEGKNAQAIARFEQWIAEHSPLN